MVKRDGHNSLPCLFITVPDPIQRAEPLYSSIPRRSASTFAWGLFAWFGDDKIIDCNS